MRFLQILSLALVLHRTLGAQPVPSARAVGLYVTPSNDTLLVFATSDSTLALGLGDGEVRGLVFQEGRFRYGPALGVFAPVQGSISFVVDDSAHARAIEWTHGGEGVRTARHVPFHEESIRFAHGNVDLAGSLIMPMTVPRSVVIFLHGSDAETREGNRAFAYSMAARGVAAFIFDQRGRGQSTGPLPAPFAELAGDAAHAVDVLRARPELASLPIGLFGPSQGAWIAAEATRQRTDIDFLILQSGDVTTPLEQELYRGAETLRRVLKVPEAEVVELTAYRREKFMVAIRGDGEAALEQLTAAARGRPWFRYVGANLPNRAFWRPNGLYDPMPALRAFRGPVLAVFGERDSYKDIVRNAEGMRGVLERTGHPASRVVVLPGANHGLFMTSTGLPLDRELPQLSRLAPGYLELLTSFASSRTRDRASSPLGAGARPQ